MPRDVYYYFQQAYARKIPPLEERLPLLRSDDVEAGFDIKTAASGRIESVEYRCSTCMTLVALCEHVAQELRGRTVEQARTLDASHLLAKHPEIPEARRSRARLAVSAAHAALEKLSI